MYDGTEFGPVCPQPNADRLMANDCLHLKILVPAEPPTVGLFPLMFWPPGGGFMFADNSYDSDAQADVIVKAGVGRSKISAVGMKTTCT